MASRAIIEVKGIKAGYGEKVVLQDVDFAVEPGEVLVIVGGSGCGKSTLLKVLIGLLTPMAGRVTIDGVDIHQAKEKDLRELRSRMGILFQSGGLISSMSLFKNVALALQGNIRCSGQTLRRLVHMKLGLVDLSGMENLLPGELSGGMKKRAGLARAMALDPPVLFFDEPSAGLDPVTAVELDELILEINGGMGTTMVIVTHELESIFRIASRVIMLDAGAKGIIAQGTPQMLRDHPPDERVERFFRRQARGNK